MDESEITRMLSAVDVEICAIIQILDDAGIPRRIGNKEANLSVRVRQLVIERNQARMEFPGRPAARINGSAQV